MLRLTNCSVPLDYTEDSLRALIARKLKCPESALLSCTVVRRGVDARDRGTCISSCPWIFV